MIQRQRLACIRGRWSSEAISMQSVPLEHAHGSPASEPNQWIQRQSVRSGQQRSAAASSGQQRPAAVSSGQQRPSAASSGQQQLTIHLIGDEYVATRSDRLDRRNGRNRPIDALELDMVHPCRRRALLVIR